MLGVAASPRRFVNGAAVAMLAAIALLAGSGEATAQSARIQNYVAQHLATGFPLTGSHESARCEDCHVGGMLKGTPKSCEVCHGSGSRFNAVTMSPSHPPVSQPCSVCHSTVTFTGTVFDHTGVLPGSCASCHNGSKAKGKPLTHLVTSESCDSCHRTLTWAGATFDHSRVRAGTCVTCHNGTIATGKSAAHMVTSASCDSCHRTIGWLPASFNHAGVTAGTCVGCHNGKGVQGAPATHIPTTASCDACHTTVRFAATAMNHNVVAGTACATCHEVGKSWFGVATVTRPTSAQNQNHPVTGDCGTCHTSTSSFSVGTAKPANHIPTAQACTVCHANAGTFKAGLMNHAGISGGCTTCHAVGSTGVAFTGVTPVPQGAGHIPINGDCATCHKSTATFAGPTMSHAGISGGCAACHEAGKSFAGVSGLKTRPTNHFPANADCGACHKSTNTFAGTAMNHAGITGGCTTCHAGGAVGKAFAGVTPKPQGAQHMATTAECSTCHTSTASFASGVTGGKPANHISTNQTCSVCHGNTTTFKGGVMSHVGISSGCASCHAAGPSGIAFTGVTPMPQGAGHIPASADCGTCHKSTASFAGTQMNHAGIGSGCIACHAAGTSGIVFTGVTPKSQGAGHLPTNADCATCHKSTASFATNVLGGKPANHLPTSAACVLCHTNPNNLVPGVMNHTGITAGCATCHDTGKAFTGVTNLKTKPTNHIPTTAACESCHAAGNFTTFAGNAVTLMNHSGITSGCTTCHAASTTGTVFLGVTPVAQGSGHIPTTADCATCHKSTTSFGNTTMVHTGISSGCATCHDAGKSFSTVKTKPLVVKPGNHIPTSATCESCHAAGNFTTFAGNAVTLMKHAVVAGTPCANCHEAGRSFVGTPAVVTRPTTSQDPNHPTTGECGTCHSSTTSFTLGITNLPANHIPVGALACTQCHAGGNTGPGSGKMSHAGITANCTTCHAASTTGTVFLGVTPVAQGSGHIPTTADCATCHKSTTSFGNTTMVHTGISSGCATCHDAGKSFSTVKTKPLVVKPGNHIPTSATCESCHAAGNFTTFAGNAVTLMKHAVVAGTPCANCHEAGRSFVGTPAVVTRPTTSQDPNHPTTGECGTCHSSTTSFTLGITNLPANHIPVGALACTQCHAGGNTGPGSGKMSHAGITANCTTCHAASTTGTVFLGVTPVAQGSGHIPTTADCATCHKSTTSFGNTTMVHTGISSGCATCHDAGKSFSTVKTKPLVVKPGNHIPTTAACESCHAAGNFTTFAGNAVTLMNHNGISNGCTTCHGVGTAELSFVGVRPKPQGTGHIPTAADCATCHTSTVKFGPGTPMNHTVVAGTPCANCHEAGRSFVGTPAVVTRPTTSQDPNHPTTGECGTCHSSTTSFTLGIVGLPANHIPVGALACTQCHAGGNTGPGSGKMSHAGITANCTTCHAASTTGTVFLGVTPVAQGSGHIPTTADCATCHKSTTSFGNTTMVHTGISSGCATCHDAGKSFSTVKTKPLVVKPGNHIPTSATCESCHAAGNFTTFAGNAVTLMKHAVVAGTPCANCHEAGRSFVGTPAVVTRPTTSQDPNHPTTGECGTCHSSTTSFTLGIIRLPANHIPVGALACTQCHAGGNTGPGRGR